MEVGKKELINEREGSYDFQDLAIICKLLTRCWTMACSVVLSSVSACHTTLHNTNDITCIFSVPPLSKLIAGYDHTL